MNETTIYKGTTTSIIGWLYAGVMTFYFLFGSTKAITCKSLHHLFIKMKIGHTQRSVQHFSNRLWFWLHLFLHQTIVPVKTNILGWWMLCGVLQTVGEWVPMLWASEIRTILSSSSSLWVLLIERLLTWQLVKKGFSVLVKKTNISYLSCKNLLIKVPILYFELWSLLPNLMLARQDLDVVIFCIILWLEGKFPLINIDI